MKIDFNDIWNKHKGQAAICLCHGPSLNYYSNRLEDFKHDGMVLLGCNEWYAFYKTIPDYWVLANNMLTVQNQINVINQFKTTVLYADSIDLTDYEWVDQNLKTNYLSYDQRHLSGHECNNKCCQFRKPILNRLSIMEQFQRYTGSDLLYQSIGTVALNMLAFAVIMGCNPVFVIGMDLDYSKGFAKNKINKRLPNVDYEKTLRSGIFQNIQIIKRSAELVGTKIINLNTMSDFHILKFGEI